jgi:hypothetical protein
MAYASSTANDMSRAAFAHVVALAAAGDGNDELRLEGLRARLRAAYRLPTIARWCSHPPEPTSNTSRLPAWRTRREAESTTFSSARRSRQRMHPVGTRPLFRQSHRARRAGHPGQCVAGLERVSLADVPVRCVEGIARTSEEVTDDIETELALARSMCRHALVHAVHGSKTGLILPELAEMDRIQRLWGGSATFVIDACQARITSEALHEYLDREAIVFLTGSKFMGGPPFNGFAVIPAGIARRAPTLPKGLAGIFSRTEWPAGWPGREILPDEGNPGLWLRFEASIFELERFQALPMAAVERVIAAFQHALRDELAQPLQLPLVRPSAPGEGDDEGEHPIEMRTLATLDVSGLPGARRFEDAQRLHHALALNGIRLGQPARCVRTDGHEWGGTLRVGLSMPQIVEFAGLDDGALRHKFAADMRTIARALRA